MVLVGPAGRGKQRLSDELASKFSGRRFIGHVRDTEERFPGLLFKLAVFLGIAGPWALPQVAVSPAAPTLIVLQGLAYDDFQNEHLNAFIAALRRQSVVKLLLTGESAPRGLQARELPLLPSAEADTVLRDAVSSAEARRRLASASGGEPLLTQLLRAVAKELGADTAEEIAASFSPDDNTKARVRRVVAALMQRQPDRYLENMGSLVTHALVADVLKESYSAVEFPTRLSIRSSCGAMTGGITASAKPSWRRWMRVAACPAGTCSLFLRGSASGPLLTRWCATGHSGRPSRIPLRVSWGAATKRRGGSSRICFAETSAAGASNKFFR